MKTDRYYEIQFEIAVANNRGDHIREHGLVQEANAILFPT